MALRIVIGDVTIGIQGQDFAYIFSVGMGGMESLYKDGKEWLYRAPRPAFWRAVTDNDRGCGFAFRSAVWSAADRFVRCSRVEARMDGEEIAIPLASANNKYTGKETCDRFEIDSSGHGGDSDLYGGNGWQNPCAGRLLWKTGSAGASGIRNAVPDAHRSGEVYL